MLLPVNAQFGFNSSAFGMKVTKLLKIHQLMSEAYKMGMCFARFLVITFECTITHMGMNHEDESVKIT